VQLFCDCGNAGDKYREMLEVLESRCGKHKFGIMTLEMFGIQPSHDISIFTKAIDSAHSEAIIQGSGKQVSWNFQIAERSILIVYWDKLTLTYMFVPLW
jgi:hypothetical protein